MILLLTPAQWFRYNYYISIPWYIAYFLHQHHIHKNIVCLQTNRRSSNTAAALPYYFWGYWELPNNRVANAYGVTPGYGWRTDIYPLEKPDVTRGNPGSGWRTTSGVVKLCFCFNNTENRGRLNICHVKMGGGKVKSWKSTAV